MPSLRRELEQIYDEFGPRLLACAYALTRGREQAEDAIHEAFCRLLRLDTPPRNLRAYVFRAVRNAAVDQLRRTRKTEPLDEERFFDHSDNPRQTAQKREFQRRVNEALWTLNEDERETIVHHLYADLGFREIAELRGRSTNTVTSWYRRGLAKLRDRLEEE